MERIGLIVAVEMDALTRRYGAPNEVLEVPGYRILRYAVGEKELFALHSGAGEIAAAAATQLLITLCHVEAIFNFGIVGGLTEGMARHRSCLVERVIHYQFDTSAADDTEIGRYLHFPDRYLRPDKTLLLQAQAALPDAPLVTCASGDKFVADPAEKRQLHDAFDADICEMEAAGIALVCHRNQIPCLMLKLVADSIGGGAEEYFEAFTEASDRAMDLLVKVLEDAP